MKEIWKDILEYEKYQISNLGRVKRKKRIFSNNRWKKRILKEMLIRPFIAKSGHLRVCLTIDGKKKNESIHRLVAKAFIPNPENKPQINHIDCDPANNNVNNLEWCTQRENTVHAIQNGLIDINELKMRLEKGRKLGSEHGMSKLIEKEIIKIKKMLKKGIKQTEIAKIFNVDATNISCIARNKTWKHIKI